MMDLFNAVPLSINISAFICLAMIIWFAGSRLTFAADSIADTLGMSRSMIGLLFLSTATSLPEIVTTLFAAISNLPEMALNNLFGGIALQTAILAIADLWTRGAISNYPRKANHALEATLLVSLLMISLITIELGEPVEVFQIGLGSVIICVCYCLCIFLLRRYEGFNDWVPVDLPIAPNSAEPKAQGPIAAKLSEINQFLLTIILIITLLVVGILIVEIASVIAIQTNVSTGFMGVLFLAAVTSLPELTTTITAVRMGAYTLAISNIFGSNLIMIVLVFPADILLRSGAILQSVSGTTKLAAILGSLLTSIYLVGLIIRRKPRLGKLGIDSVVVLVFYLTGMFLFWLYR